jgi:predicted metal-dependent hydrolase
MARFRPKRPCWRRRSCAVGPEGYRAVVPIPRQATPAPATVPEVEVRRSARRTRTVTAFRENGRLVVAIPDRFTRVQEREWVKRMVAKVESAERRRRPSDEQLAARAEVLSRRYLGGQARPTSVAWSARQGRRWGSCTVAEGSIRISTRVQGMPTWVIDYVLLHELAHLLCAGHGPAFWALLGGYPHLDRARGFLEGVAHASDMPFSDDDLDEAQALVGEPLVDDGAPHPGEAASL